MGCLLNISLFSPDSLQLHLVLRVHHKYFNLKLLLMLYFTTFCFLSITLISVVCWAREASPTLTSTIEIEILPRSDYVQKNAWHPPEGKVPHIA